MFSPLLTHISIVIFLRTLNFNYADPITRFIQSQNCDIIFVSIGRNCSRKSLLNIGYKFAALCHTIVLTVND